MQRSTKIILSIFAVLAVLVLIAAALAVWFVARNAEGWVEQGTGKYEAGQAAGAELDSAGCVDRAMADYKRDTGPISAMSVHLWLNGCLETAEVDAGICPEMKGDSTLGRVGELIAWRQTFCARHGLAADQNCQQIAAGIEEFCYEPYDMPTEDVQVEGMPVEGMPVDGAQTEGPPTGDTPTESVPAGSAAP